MEPRGKYGSADKPSKETFRNAFNNAFDDAISNVFSASAAEEQG